MSVWFERQLTEQLGGRVGFVYKTEDDLISNNFQRDRGPDAYTVPFTVTDPGPDGRANTGDEQPLTFYGFPSSLAETSPRKRASAAATASSRRSQLRSHDPDNADVISSLVASLSNEPSSSATDTYSRRRESPALAQAVNE